MISIMMNSQSIVLIILCTIDLDKSHFVVSVGDNASISVLNLVSIFFQTAHVVGFLSPSTPAIRSLFRVHCSKVVNSSRTQLRQFPTLRGENWNLADHSSEHHYCSALRRLRAAILWVDDTQGRRSVVILGAGRAPPLYHYVSFALQFCKLDNRQNFNHNAEGFLFK
jgi:hypothetical protein